MYISEACSGNGTKLSGHEGLIWMTAPLYQNNVYCQWQIKVDVGKVSAVYIPTIYFDKSNCIYMICTYSCKYVICNIDANINVVCQALSWIETIVMFYYEIVTRPNIFFLMFFMFKKISINTYKSIDFKRHVHLAIS